MESRICELPDEILNDILSRLPATSVLNCRCVCKAFDLLTKSPNFIATHRNRSTGSTNTRCSVHYRSISSDHTVLIQEDDKFVFSLKHMSNPTPNNYSIVGCSNGLFCVEVEENSFMFWNPITKQTRRLPNPQEYTDRLPDESYGFGFVPETNEYKLVQIIYDSDIINISAPSIQVYRTSSDSWSIIDDTSVTLFDSLKNIAGYDAFYTDGWSSSSSSLHDVGMDIEGAITDFNLFDATPQLFKGALHWTGLVPIPCSRVSSYGMADDACLLGILSFDLRDEQLRLVDVLSYDMIGRSSYKNAGLGILRESLYLIVSNYIGGSCLDIWLMKDYGIRESWTKQFSFTQEYIPRRSIVYGCWKDYLLIIEGYEKPRRLSMLDLGTLAIKSFPIPLPHNDYNSLSYFSFVETLVPVTPESAIAKDVDV